MPNPLSGSGGAMPEFALPIGSLIGPRGGSNRSATRRTADIKSRRQRGAFLSKIMMEAHARAKADYADELPCRGRAHHVSRPYSYYLGLQMRSGFAEPSGRKLRRPKRWPPGHASGLPFDKSGLISGDRFNRRNSSADAALRHPFTASTACAPSKHPPMKARRAHTKKVRPTIRQTSECPSFLFARLSSEVELAQRAL